MIEKYELEPSQCWVVGDKWIDPQTGISAGMQGALIRTGKPIGEELDKLARSSEVPIYSDLQEFVSKELAL